MLGWLRGRRDVAICIAAGENNFLAGISRACHANLTKGQLIKLDHHHFMLGAV